MIVEQDEQDIAGLTKLPDLAALSQDKPPAAAPGAVILDVRNVSIWYSSFKAVTDVSLTIYEREITAFIGSSGNGKTTVLRSFNRMNDLVPGSRLEGEIYYRGESLYGPDVSSIAVRRRIGMVFQKPNLRHRPGGLRRLGRAQGTVVVSWFNRARAATSTAVTAPCADGPGASWPGRAWMIAMMSSG